MNKRSRKNRGIPQRIAALLLCCVCLFGAVSVSAIALKVEASPMTETTAPTETTVPTETTAPGETTAPAETTAPTETTAPAETTVPTETEETTALEETDPTEGTEETTAVETENTENTDPSEETENTDPSEETDPTEETAEKTPAEALYDRLMAYETFEELDAALNALTEEEQALLDQFTDEQNAALEAKIKELGGYAVDVLVPYNGTLTITDTITSNGRLTVSETATTGQTLTYTWESSTDNVNWTTVTRTKVTGDEYNVAEDGSWVNVALDDGAQKYYRAKVATVDGNPVDNEVYTDSRQVAYYAQLRNGSFETPAVSGGMQEYIGSGASGIVWQTTADDPRIELVNPENALAASFQWHGVYSAAESKQCAEINAEGAGALFQDVLTIPGSTMYWQLSHLGRSMNNNPVGAPTRNGTGSEKTDTMYVLIMPYDSAQSITTQTAVQGVISNPTAYPGAVVQKITYTWRWVKSGNSYTMQHSINGEWKDTFTCTVTTSGSSTTVSNVKQVLNPWESHSGTYTVPENQYLTRYFFVSGDTASSNNTVGNHIDNVWFSTEVPKPNPGKANLTIQKTINVDGWETMSEAEQNRFKDSLTFTYGNTTITGRQMTWDGNVGTYSITNITVGAGGTASATVTEEVGEVENYIWQQSKKEETVTLTDGGTAVAEFTNTYTLAKKDLTIKKTLSGNMYNANDKFEFTVEYDGNVGTYTLGKDETTEKISIPIGAKVTITEGSNSYTFTAEVKPDDIPDLEINNNGKTLSFTMPNEDVSITVNNDKTITVDTGVSLDSLPFVLILGFAAVGAAVLVRTRRGRYDR